MGNQQSALLDAASRGDAATCRLLAPDSRTDINTVDKDGAFRKHATLYSSQGPRSEATK